MDYLQKVRKDYSITQNRLAEFLGLKRSSLAMGELGKRNILSSQLIIRLDALINAFEAVEKHLNAEDIIALTDAEQIEMLHFLEKECSILRQKIYIQERKLENLNEKRLGTKKSILALKKMEANKDLFPKMSLDLEWITTQIRIQEQLLQKTSMVKIIQSKIKITTFREELRSLEVELNNLK